MTDQDDRAFRRDFYRAVEQRQASDPRQSEYYVPIYDDPELRSQDVVSTLQDGIEFSAGQSVQILSGFRGSGKTSELLRLQTQLRNDGYAVVYLDIEDYFNTELPVNGATFEFALAAGFADNSEDQQVLKPGGETGWQRLQRFFKRIDLQVEVAAGPVNVKAALREDESFQAQVENIARNNRRKFRESLHLFFVESAAALNNAVGTVFIVDSIDHFRGRTERFQEVRESVEMLFSESAEDLTLPNMNVIYTVPVYVQPALGLRRDVLNMKVAEKDGERCTPGMRALERVLKRRAPGGNLERLLGGEVERVLHNSGGLFRDLLRLTSEVALTAHGLPASPEEITRAEATVRANMQSALSLEQIDILRRVHETKKLLPAKDEWPDVTDLMASGAVLKYPNGQEPWFGVHPLLQSLLTEQTS
jgi:hypothetical protein